MATGLKEPGTSHGHLLDGLGLPGRVLGGSVCAKQDEQTGGLRIFSWMGLFWWVSQSEKLVAALFLQDPGFLPMLSKKSQVQKQV